MYILCTAIARVRILPRTHVLRLSWRIHFKIWAIIYKIEIKALNNKTWLSLLMFVAKSWNNKQTVKASQSVNYIINVSHWKSRLCERPSHDWINPSDFSLPYHRDLEMCCVFVKPSLEPSSFQTRLTTRLSVNCKPR